MKGLPMSLKLLHKKADGLWRTGKLDYCEKCGERADVSPHHIIGRTNKTLRWDLKNRIWLCNFCHIQLAHGRPTEFKDWLKNNRDYDYLMERRNIISKFTEEDMKKIIEELK